MRTRNLGACSPAGMAGRGRAMSAAPRPTAITLHRASRVLEVAFDDGSVARLDADTTRAYYRHTGGLLKKHGIAQQIIPARPRRIS